MRNWELSLAMVTFGPICICCGIAARDPETPDAFRWGMIGVGVLFATMGVVSFVFGRPRDIVKFDYEQNRGALRLLSRLVALFGAVGLLSVAVAPSLIPWEGNAPWIGWVFVAWFLWAIMVGAGLAHAASEVHKDE